MDWTKCVICQMKTTENTVCPNRGKRFNAKEVYHNFLNNVNVFRNLEALPCRITFDENCTADMFVENNACWHKNCYQQFKNDKLERLTKKRKDPERESLQRRTSRRRTSVTPTISNCIFCATDTGTLINYATKCAEKSLRMMATEMDDTEILEQISSGDLVALEAKYHFICLTKYRNKYQTFCRQKDRGISSGRAMRARAFIEIIANIESELEDGVKTFQLNKLHMAYTKRLRELGVNSVINQTQFKNKLLGHFKDLGLIEVSKVGKPTSLIFPDGVKEILEESNTLRNFENEAFLFSKVAKICRKEIFTGMNRNVFLGNTFENPSPAESSTPSLDLLVSMLLYGTSLNNNISTSLPVSSISKQIYFNSKKYRHSREATPPATSRRHQVDREPDLATYIGLKMHYATRSKTLTEILGCLGIGITYKRVFQIEDSLARSVCRQAFEDGIVCPSHLRRGLYTVAALDNIDYNPSSTTAIGSFHGTGISIIQFPTRENPGISRQIQFTEKTDVIALPDEYRIVPAVFLKSTTETVIPESRMRQYKGMFEKALSEEQLWLDYAMEMMDSSTYREDVNVTWSAFHASRQASHGSTPAITALLPLFDEKADTPSMVKHGMETIKKTTHFINPQQVPVMACDCPIFAVAKQIQWRFPEVLGENKFIVMFGGLHLEKGLWNALGDLLEGSGWSTAISEAGISTSGSAQALLRCAHITRTRHAHQVTAVALTKLQRQAYIHAETYESFQEWRSSMMHHPTFLFWDIILETELNILIFIRAHREKRFNLYVEALSNLMWLFFSLDHYNYSRWLSVHLRDMLSLPEGTKSEFEKNWVVNKTGKRFSFLPIDQVHEQENCKVKGDGGAVGLTQNPHAFNRWMLAGPEQARLIHDFEESFIPSNADFDFRHHEEGEASQRRFLEQINDLQLTIENEFGNPFEDKCPELVILDTRCCADDTVIKTIQDIKCIGQQQYETFKEEVLIKREKSVHTRLKRNSLPLFKTPKTKADITGKQIASLRSNVALCSRMFIANQQRQGDLAEFFSHENQPYPPSLSDFGNLYTGSKSELLKAFETVSQIDENFDCSIQDGGLLLHTIQPTGNTFQEYADEFAQYIKRLLRNVKRVDIVQDRYFQSSIKNGTRESRGVGGRIKISGNSKIPQKVNFKDFLRNSQNKEELNELISQTVANTVFQSDQDVYITQKESVFHIGPGLEMEVSQYEEADVRIIVHMKHALDCGHENFIVRTSDTDVLVLIIGHFHKLEEMYSRLRVTVDFGTGKTRKLFDVRGICEKLGRDKSISLPVFHSFTGTDTTSAFRGRGKKTAWSTWEHFSDVTEAFMFMANNPFYPVDAQAVHFKKLEHFTVLMYDKSAYTESVNDVRRSLFTKKSRSFEHLPPTQVSNALHYFPI